MKKLNAMDRLRRKYSKEVRRCGSFVRVRELRRSAFGVTLKVHHQSFDVGPQDYPTRDEAEFMRIMLCVALFRIVKKVAKD